MEQSKLQHGLNRFVFFLNCSLKKEINFLIENLNYTYVSLNFPYLRRDKYTR